MGSTSHTVSASVADQNTSNSLMNNVEADIEQILLTQFKAAACSVTQLYKESLKQNRRAYHVGYAQCLFDLWQFVSNNSTMVPNDPSRTPAPQPSTPQQQQQQQHQQPQQNASASSTAVVSFGDLSTFMRSKYGQIQEAAGCDFGLPDFSSDVNMRSQASSDASSEDLPNSNKISPSNYRTNSDSPAPPQSQQPTAAPTSVSLFTSANEQQNQPQQLPSPQSNPLLGGQSAMNVLPPSVAAFDFSISGLLGTGNNGGGEGIPQTRFGSLPTGQLMSSSAFPTTTPGGREGMFGGSTLDGQLGRPNANVGMVGFGLVPPVTNNAFGGGAVNNGGFGIPDSLKRRWGAQELTFLGRSVNLDGFIGEPAFKRARWKRDEKMSE